MNALDFPALAALAGDKDVPCPLCGPTSGNPKKRVLKIWLVAPDFATYSCARCGEHGWASDRGAKRLDRAEVERRMRQTRAHNGVEAVRRRGRAAWLWRQSVPIERTVAARYLDRRGIAVRPPTLRFLPARGEHPPAMIAAFGMPPEPEPGAYAPLAAAAVGAVHLTKLALDGTKLNKIMVGVTGEAPVALVPPNDLGGLAIAEGIETALSAHQATGLGAWAAGSANRLPKLAPIIAGLSYIEAVTIWGEDDQAGRAGADGLANELEQRRPDIEVRIVEGRP